MKNRPDLAVATGLGRGVVAKGVLALAGRGGLIGAAIMAADELFSRCRPAA